MSNEEKVIETKEEELCDEAIKELSNNKGTKNHE